MADKVIFTDIDLTLLDFNFPFEHYLRSVGYDLPHGSLKDLCAISGQFGFTPLQAKQLVHDFFETDHFGNLPAMEDTIGPIRELHADGWEFVAISACPATLDSKIRHDNLEDVFQIPFKEVHLSGFDISKKTILQQFKPTIWVEDHVKNAEAGHELGYETFLLNRKYNIHEHTLVKRVDTWHDIKNYINKVCVNSST